jgi:hypothetical protein
MAYEAPEPAELILRYPAFAAVDEAVIQYWLTDAEREVGTTWIEADYAPALMALAAHNMTLAGYGTDAASTELPSGITSFKSAELSVSFANEVAAANAAGAYAATRYGVEFRRLQRRSKAGPRVASPGAVPAPPWPYPTGAW